MVDFANFMHKKICNFLIIFRLSEKQFSTFHEKFAGERSPAHLKYQWQVLNRLSFVYSDRPECAKQEYTIIQATCIYISLNDSNE